MEEFLNLLGLFLKISFLIKKKPVKMDSEINPNSVVKLNVGGTMFMTTQGTLLSDQNSMLAKMFSPATNGRRFPGMGL